MIYGSVCSGIEAATVAWHPLGWKPAFFSEIEKFPRAVLEHHYSNAPIHGDFTTIQKDDYEPIELLVGGTPCQSFSVAGLRGGLDDERGGLAMEFVELAKRIRARWIVWENVPGVLSSGRGYDFGAFIGALAKCGYGFAYRVLDAQYFGVPQRRCRVFLVGYFGDYRPAAAVLFEPESLRGDPAPCRKTRQDVAPTIAARATGGGGLGTDFDCTDTLIAHALRGEGFDASEDGTGRGTPIVPIAFDCKAGGNTGLSVGDIPGTLRGEGHGGGHAAVVIPQIGVRRLTPRECERLQGFPDDYTQVPFRGRAAADGPRYKAIGNSMAVPVMRWIGNRIEAMEQTTRGAG